MSSDPTVADAERELNGALAAAQGEFPPIGRDQTADTGRYSYGYASLAAIIAAVRPALAQHGLAIVQRLEAPAGVPSLRTELRHDGGGVLAGSIPLFLLQQQPETPQQLGSLLTYLRRYALVSMLGIAPDMDDDGTAVAKPPASARPTPPAPDAGGFTSPVFDQISDSQRRRLHAMFRERGLEDRDERLAYCSRVVDHPVPSSSMLSKGEATAIIAYIETNWPVNEDVPL